MTWLLALLLLASPARAQEDAEGVEQQETDAERARTLREMRERLKSDPSVADSLARRIAGSSLAPSLSSADDAEARVRDIREWIAADPESAAQVASGLARDDADGTRSFEEGLSRSMRSKLRFNPGSGNNIYGRLKKSGGDSKLLKKDAEMTEEERREIIKTMFEGRGGMSNKIVTPKDDAKDPKDRASSFAGGYYDRLSGANLRGYSPQVLAIQSSLNARRAPGAPKLAETGKLDYETLSYPSYGMRHDVGGLEARLRFERNYQSARLLGLDKDYTPQQLLDPEVEASLKEKGAALKLSPRFARRQEALERAAAAVRDFQSAALPAKQPSGLDAALLKALGARQKEAARWITIASLEEELQRLDAEAGFLGPELLALVEACPMPEAARRDYKGRGELLLKSVLKLKANDEEAARLLASDAWEPAVAQVEALLASNGALRAGLSRNIRDFVAVPYRFAALSAPRPRWRELVDAAILRWLPNTAYGRRLGRVEAERGVLKQAFLKIAAGEFDAAHSALEPR